MSAMPPPTAATDLRSWTATIVGRTPDIAAQIRSRLAQNYWVFASAVLLLAAFNLTFRLGREIVVEWDESL